MPIKGVTDQKASFPRLGVLRKGAPKSGNRPGQDLTFFRFVSDDPDAMGAFVEAYGQEPRRINVYLPFATCDDNLEAWMEEWGSGSLKHRCDGETCVLWQDESGQYQDTPKPCPGNCKPVGRLMVIIPDLERLAYVLVLTTSWWDCQELASNLTAAEETARLMERDLRGIPFVLTRVPRMISTPPREKGGKRIRAEKWLLHIEPAPSWVKLQIEAARRMATPQLIEGPEDIPAPNGDGDDEVIDATAVIEHELPEEGGNGDREQAKTKFYDRVLEDIPYYNHRRHVVNTLKKLDFTGYSLDKEKEMFQALQEYASREANKELVEEELPL